MTALQTTPIFRQREFYVPRFELFLGNQPVRGELLRDVMQVTYKDDIEKIDTFELTINNWDSERRTFKHHDSDRLNPEQKVRLHMGYLDDRGGLPLMLQGKITEMSPSFPAAGQPLLKVSGQNILNDFCRKQESHSYSAPFATASHVARAICGRLGVRFRNRTGHEAEEVSHDHLIQHNQVDILFLLDLARQEGYEIVVCEGDTPADTTLCFERSAEAGRTVYELKYGATLTEFQPTLSTAKQVSAVEVRGWDPVQGRAIKVEVGQQQLHGAGGLRSRLKPGTGDLLPGRREVIVEQPVRDAQTATALARATLARINQELVTGTGSVVGLPELRAGSQLYLWGLGKRFSGRYFVKATTHTIGMSGYVTQFECRLEELIEDPTARGAT